MAGYKGLDFADEVSQKTDAELTQICCNPDSYQLEFVAFAAQEMEKRKLRPFSPSLQNALEFVANKVKDGVCSFSGIVRSVYADLKGGTDVLYPDIKKAYELLVVIARISEKKEVLLKLDNLRVVSQFNYEEFKWGIYQKHVAEMARQERGRRRKERIRKMQQWNVTIRRFSFRPVFKKAGSFLRIPKLPFFLYALVALVALNIWMVQHKTYLLGKNKVSASYYENWQNLPGTAVEYWGMGEWVMSVIFVLYVLIGWGLVYRLMPLLQRQQS